MKRRFFIEKTALASMSTLLGAEIVLGATMPDGYTPLAFQEPDPFKMFGKDREMVVLNSKPWNMEAQAHLLDDKITPSKFMFIRNNGLIPENIDVANWSLTIDGESVETKKTRPLTCSKEWHPTVPLKVGHTLQSRC